MGCGSNSDAAAQVRDQQVAQQKQVDTGLSAIARAYKGFTPKFYQNRAKAYENFALPQLGEQFQVQQRNLTGQLVNQGIQKGSAAMQLKDSLAKALATQQRNVANSALGQAQQLESDVNQSRNQVTAQLQASADPVSAAQSATAAASQYSAPSPLPAFGNAFSDWINIYNTGKAVQGQNNANNAFLQGYNQRPMSIGGLPFNFKG